MPTHPMKAHILTAYVGNEATAIGGRIEDRSSLSADIVVDTLKTRADDGTDIIVSVGYSKSNEGVSVKLADIDLIVFDHIIGKNALNANLLLTLSNGHMVRIKGDYEGTLNAVIAAAMNSPTPGTWVKLKNVGKTKDIIWFRHASYGCHQVEAI